MVEKSFKDLVECSKRLRKECAWDRKETIESFSKYLDEEVKEVLETIDQNDHFSLRDELGDVLWNVLFIANLAEEKKLFTLKEVLQNTHEKMVRRHPHVYGDSPGDLDSIHNEWVRIKAEEKIWKADKRKAFNERLAKGAKNE